MKYKLKQNRIKKTPTKRAICSLMKRLRRSSVRCFPFLRRDTAKQPSRAY